METSIICSFEYNPIYSSSNSACSMVHLNFKVRMYGSFGHPFLLIRSISSSQCLILGYAVWSWFEDKTVSLAFDTQWIRTINVVFGISGRLLFSLPLDQSPKLSPVTCCLCIPFSSPTEIHMCSASKTSPPITDESIWHYWHYAVPASSQMSPDNLQPLFPSAAVHL